MAVRRLTGFVMLARPHNVVVSVLNALVGVFTVEWLLGCECSLYTVLYAVLAVALVAAGGYAINDYFDADIDAVDKPYRPIPAGLVTPGEAYFYSLVLLASGIASGFLASPLHGVYAAVVAALLYLYPARMKRGSALAGHLTVAFTGASTIIYGGLAAGMCCNPIGSLAAVLIPALYAFLLILAREFVKALEDVRGDRERGAHTIATVYGMRVARTLSALLLTLVALVSPLPYILGRYTLLYLVPALTVAALCIYSTLLIARNAYSRARRVLKIAFGVGGIAFLLDPVAHLSGILAG